MRLVLCHAPVACSLVPFMTLTEACAEFEVRAISLRKHQNSDDEFRAINPKKKVPVLIVDGDPITENVAIQLWIARQYPAARLLPSDPLQEIKAISLMSWCASGLHPTLTPQVFPHRYCDAPGSADGVIRCARKALLGMLELADAMLKDRDWFFDHFSAADAYFFWCFRRATQIGVNPAEFSHCSAHFDRTMNRAATQSAVAYERTMLSTYS